MIAAPPILCSAAILAAFPDAGKMPALRENCHQMMQPSIICA